MLTIAILMFIPGMLLIFWINKRKFKRRNVAGLEGFSSYEKSLFIRFLEGIGKWIAYALILFSLFLFLTYSLEKRQKEKATKIDKTSIRSTR
jgi:hypothetical protein